MKIETQPRDDHQVQVTAEFEQGTIEKYKRISARKLAQKAKIPGFRPGKAPYDVILRLYGEKALEEEAIETMVEEVYPKILDEAKINPGAPGSLEEVLSTEPVKLSFVVPLEPTVELGDYRSVREEYNLEPVSEAEIDDFILRLRRNYAVAEPVDRPAQEGDLVSLKIDGHLTHPVDDENPEVLNDNPLQIVIGENDPDVSDFPYLGFGDELRGLAANDEKTFTYTYPSDSKYDRLRGKEVEFHITVQNVKSLNLPEVNDEFAQTLGNFENVAKLRETVQEQLNDQKKADYDEDYFERVFDALGKLAVIKYPPQVLQDEVDHTIEHIEEDLAQQKLELDVYLKTLKKTKEEWIENEIKPAARKSLERSLLVDEIARAEKIELSNDELNAEFNNLAIQMQQQQDFKKLQRKFSNDSLANAIAVQAASRLMNQHVRERIKEIATGNAPSLEPKTEAVPAESQQAKAEGSGTIEPQAAADVQASAVSSEETPVEVAKPKRKKKSVEG